MAQIFFVNNFNSLKHSIESLTYHFFNRLTPKLDWSYSIRFDATKIYPHKNSLNLRLRINGIEFMQKYIIWRFLVAYILMKFKRVIVRQYKDLSFNDFREYLQIMMLFN